MQKWIQEKFNGSSVVIGLILRVIIFVLLPVIGFMTVQLSKDIRTKFNEITYEVREIRTDVRDLKGEILTKDIYFVNHEMLSCRVDRIEDRLNEGVN